MSEMMKIAIFKGKQIRRIIYQDEWWFSVVDVCGALTASFDSGAYWRKLKQRLKEEGSEVVTFCHGLKLEASDGKKVSTKLNYLDRSLLKQLVSSDYTRFFELAGYKIAMGNGSDELKEKADFIALNVEEDGLAIAIEKLAS